MEGTIWEDPLFYVDGNISELNRRQNRLIIPAKFRDDLGFKCVLSRGLDDCLVIYTMSAWEELQAKLAKLPTTDPEARALVRFFYKNSTDCEIDKQGRTVLPQTWRDMAHIQKDLVTIGMIDRIEIWAREVYEDDEKGGKLSAEQFADISGKYQI